MQKTLALIHTSLLFVGSDPMLRDLLKEILPDTRIINIVDDSLLADVMARGKITTAVRQRMTAYIQSAELAGADVILSMCSSVGPVVDEARKLVHVPLIKIDDAMTEKAVNEAQRIGVLATVATTLDPTVGLLEEKARILQKPAQIRPELIEGGLQILLAGDRERHDDMVSAAARKLQGQVDLLMLAQASMTRLAPRIAQETGLPVLTSPRLALEYTRSILDMQPEAAARD